MGEFLLKHEDDKKHPEMKFTVEESLWLFDCDFQGTGYGILGEEGKW